MHDATHCYTAVNDKSYNYTRETVTIFIDFDESQKYVALSKKMKQSCEIKVSLGKNPVDCETFSLTRLCRLRYAYIKIFKWRCDNLFSSDIIAS